MILKERVNKKVRMNTTRQSALAIMSKLDCPRFFDLVVRDAPFNLKKTMEKHKKIYSLTGKNFLIVLDDSLPINEQPERVDGFMGMCHLRDFKDRVKHFNRVLDRPDFKDIAMEPLRSTMRTNQLKTSRDALVGLNFTLTGVFKRWSRDEMKEMIEKCGGSVSDNIRIRDCPTDFLVMGEGVGATKMNRARQNDVLIIDEKEFVDMITY